MNNLVFFIDENIPLIPEVFKNHAIIYKFKGRELKNEDLKLKKCNALICRSTTLVNDKLLDGTDVNFVATATSGVDHIDLEYLNKKNIFFTYAPGSNSNSVAEYVIFSILEWENRFSIDLRTKTIGIIGTGNIGKIVALYSHLLGLKVIINDPPLKDLGKEFPYYVSYVKIADIFKFADIITNHVPLTYSGPYPTKYLINKLLLEKMKNNSLFIHTSRGKVVDEKALVKMISKKNISTVIDVWEKEPLINEELAKLSLIATPHIAGYSFDGKLKGALIISNTLTDFYNLKVDLSLIENSLTKNVLFDFSIFEDHFELYNILKNKRQILADAENLKKIFNLPVKNKGKYFDRLRKKYPVRRESIMMR